MAILDLFNAKQAVDMTDPGLVTFGSFAASSTTQWDWRTPGQHQVNSFGANLTFDGTGHATGGTINEIGIDLGANDFNDPDVTITGISVAAAPLDDSPESFWDVLSGNDLIIGPSAAAVGNGVLSVIFGDGLAAKAGATAGGNDDFQLGDSRLYAYGDVFKVEAQAIGPSAPVYNAGNDKMSGLATTEIQSITGDVWLVIGPAKLTGGSDNITMRSSAIASRAVGDAVNMQGTIDGMAVVIGGHDVIVAAQGSVAELVGDVANQGGFSLLNGGDDFILGNSGSELLIGDVHNGGGTLIGGADEINGLGGADLIVGDVFNQDGNVIGGDDKLHGGAGNDSIFGDYTNRLSGSLSGGDDQLYGDEGDDFLFGQSGRDFLEGGTGADQMFGGKDNDNYVVDSALDAVTELAGEGFDLIYTALDSYTLGDNVENLQYIGFHSFLAKGNSLSNRIDGGNGDDTFILDGSGNDEFNGSFGFDTIDNRALGGAVINLTSNVNGGSATGDRFYSFERIFGSVTGADVLTAGPGSNLLAPGERVVFFGYGGNDVLTGGSGADSLYGGDGNDRIVGGEGDDALLGDGGNDAILGGAGADMLNGADGNDTLVGGTGADDMSGGLGNDRYIVDSAADTILENIGGGSDRVYSSVNYTLAAGQEVETLSTDNDAGNSSIRLTGNELNNNIVGNNGVNILNGAAGIDRLFGFGGNDFFYVDNAADNVFEAAGGGTDKVLSSVSYTLAAGQEIEILSTVSTAKTDAINLTGNALANTIVGNSGANALNGGAGADKLYGLGGRDLYFVDSAADAVFEAAGGGIDRVFASASYALTAGQEIEALTTANAAGTDAINLTGNAFNNAVVGNNGANALNGGLGNDKLTGYLGSDIFVFNTALNAAANHDTITDFNVAADTIHLENAVFTKLAATGTLAANLFRDLSLGAQDADDVIIYNRETGDLFYDSNGLGAGGQTLFADVTNGLALTNLDFFVI